MTYILIMYFACCFSIMMSHLPFLNVEGGKYPALKTLFIGIFWPYFMAEALYKMGIFFVTQLIKDIKNIISDNSSTSQKEDNNSQKENT